MTIHIYWSPREDITIYQLAVCLPYATQNVRPTVERFQEMSANTRRHFAVIFDPKDAEALAWVNRWVVS